MSDSLQLLWLCATVFHVGCLCSVLQLWECGIEQCKEIASQLETVTYNFEKLSEIHVRACISFSEVFLFKCNSVHVMNCNIKLWFKILHLSENHCPLLPQHYPRVEGGAGVLPSRVFRRIPSLSEGAAQTLNVHYILSEYACTCIRVRVTASQNKVFIFRGHEFEKLAEFNARLYTIFPNTRFMKTLETPGLDIMESRDQCILPLCVGPGREGGNGE